MLLLFLLVIASSFSASSFSEDLDALNEMIGNGEYKKGLSGALIIAEKAQAANDTAVLGKAYLLISDAHYYLCNADLYRSYVEKALKAFLQINDASGIGQSYYNLAYCYERIDPLKMLRLLEQALPYSKQSKDLKLQMKIENATGTTLWHLGRFSDSIPHLEESGKIADQLNEASYKGTVLQNLALDYEYLADYDRALKLYKEALAIAEKTFILHFLNHDPSGSTFLQPS